MSTLGLPLRSTRLPWRRLVQVAVMMGAVAWAFAWGAHGHDVLVRGVDLSAVQVDRTFVVDASTGTLDLSSIVAQPGDVVEFVLEGSAGAPHAFVLMGAAPGSEMDESLAPNGDTVIRLRMPESGALSFTCIIPGHEGLHGSLVVGARN